MTHAEDGACLSQRIKTLFIAAENGPIKATRLLKRLNKKKVKVAAGEAPRGEEQAERPVIPECRGKAAGFLAKRLLGTALLVGHLAECTCFLL